MPESKPRQTIARITIEAHNDTGKGAFPACTASAIKTENQIWYKIAQTAAGPFGLLGKSDQIALTQIQARELAAWLVKILPTEKKVK
jgi:hypothetical protein